MTNQIRCLGCSRSPTEDETLYIDREKTTWVCPRCTEAASATIDAVKKMVSRRVSLRRMRCMGCRRAPTSEEVEEMIVTFDSDPNDKLVWRCLRCQKKTGAA